MIAVINSGGANLNSVCIALRRHHSEVVLTQDPTEICRATHIILPGVGTAAAVMQRLYEIGLVKLVKSLIQPVLGICVGMQIMYEASEEGEVSGLGIIPGKVELMPIFPGITIPHTGWNVLKILDSSCELLRELDPDSYVYFVHSYAATVGLSTKGSIWHGQNYTAICQRENFYGVQFHPEKSGEVGEQILKNFLAL